MKSCDICGAERADTYELRRVVGGVSVAWGTAIIPQADMCRDCAEKVIHNLLPEWPGPNPKENPNETR